MNQTLSRTEAPGPQGLVCFGCGYDLRAIDFEKDCPECGESVARSAAFAASRLPRMKKACRGLWILAASLYGAASVPFVLVLAGNWLHSSVVGPASLLYFISVVQGVWLLGMLALVRVSKWPPTAARRLKWGLRAAVIELCAALLSVTGLIVLSTSVALTGAFLSLFLIGIALACRVVSLRAASGVAIAQLKFLKAGVAAGLCQFIATVGVIGVTATGIGTLSLAAVATVPAGMEHTLVQDLIGIWMLLGGLGTIALWVLSFLGGIAFTYASLRTQAYLNHLGMGRHD